MKYLTIIPEYKGRYITLWFNRPDKRNALNQQIIDEMHYFISHQLPKEKVDFLVIRGKGKTFCSGADLNEFVSDHRFLFAQKLDDLFYELNNIQMPVISIVHGKVFGGALGLLATSDIVLADEGSQFCFSEVKLGLIPAIISPYLEKKLNYSWLKYLIISAEVFNTDTALKIGMVHKIISFSEETAIDKFINDLLNNNTMAIFEAKGLLERIKVNNNLDIKRDLSLQKLIDMLNDIEVLKRIKRFLLKQD